MLTLIVGHIWNLELVEPKNFFMKIKIKCNYQIWV